MPSKGRESVRGRLTSLGGSRLTWVGEPLIGPLERYFLDSMEKRLNLKRWNINMLITAQGVRVKPYRSGFGWECSQQKFPIGGKEGGIKLADRSAKSKKFNCFLFCHGPRL